MGLCKGKRPRASTRRNIQNGMDFVALLLRKMRDGRSRRRKVSRENARDQFRKKLSAFRGDIYRFFGAARPHRFGQILPGIPAERKGMCHCADVSLFPRYQKRSGGRLQAIAAAAFAKISNPRKGIEQQSYAAR